MYNLSKTQNINQLMVEDKPIHNWYRFVLSFPPHLVRKYIKEFELTDKSTVLDPFCGTGTTLVEAKLNQINSIGIEANPFPFFASQTKLNWNICVDTFLGEVNKIFQQVNLRLQQQGLNDFFSIPETHNFTIKFLEKETHKLLIKDSISPIPLHKTLILLETIKEHKYIYQNHFLLALGKALVFGIGNLKFAPEVGIGKIKFDVPVLETWLKEVNNMIKDLKTISYNNPILSEVIFADSRNIASLIEPNSIDAVITSPPYPNEKDYSRTTRLESVILGFIQDRQHLQDVKKSLLRSNTRGVYSNDDDDKYVVDFPEICEIAHEIERKRVDMGKTSGFEKLYPKVTMLYFGGMYKHLAELRVTLKNKAKLAYVVGDQASYLNTYIPTGKIIANIAQKLGYTWLRTDLFRTRFATKTKMNMKEEVLVLQWNN